MDLKSVHSALCRASFEHWCEHALAPLGQTPAPHHRLLIRELERVASGATKRLMVCMPPGSAKSTYAILFVAWFLARMPRAKIIGASHTADLAERFSRTAQDVIRDNTDILGFRLARESVQDWDTSSRGEYKAAGVGGPITGRRADLVIIDDPVKGRAQADSEIERENTWNWYRANLRTRLRPGASIVLIMTRWHEDDLGGRLLDTQRHLWRVVSLPAQAIEGDPLGRSPGEWLWDGDPKYGYADELRSVLAEAEASGGMRDWQSMYQQDPRPGEGALFKVAMIGAIEAEPASWRWLRAWDLAATEDVGTANPDWTVGVKMGKGPDGQFVVADVVRVRGGPDVVERLIKATADRDGKSVRISLPQDPGQAGKSQVLYLTRKLVGYTVESSPETGDKSTRAAPLASQMNVGNVAIVRGSWNAPYLDELSTFPSGSKDDQVDASSRAFNGLIAPPAPARTVDINIMGR